MRKPIVLAIMSLAMSTAAFADHAKFNQWTCFAEPQAFVAGAHLVYEGYSQIFPPGSGQGRQARSTAKHKALQTCESTTGVNCQNSHQDCEVTRFQMERPSGKWVQTYARSCQRVCSSKGLRVAESKEGAECASGENRPGSALQAGISFVYGTWPNKQPEYSNNADSQRGYCYKPGQKKDYDSTDLTVGCFCR